MRKLSTVVLVAALVSQLGCMSSAIKEAELPPLSPEVQSRFAKLPPAAVIADAEAQIKAAYIAQLDFYSPQYLKRAEEALKAAKKEARSQKPGQRGELVYILALEAALARAAETKSAVLAQMSDVFKLREALDRVDAGHYKKRTYDKLMSRIQELISHIEAQRSDKFAAKLPVLIEDMTEFETHTIVHNALYPAALALEEAEDVDADDYAPRSFAKAELTYERAEKRIRANPHDASTVTRLGNEALVEARHAFYVSRAVAALQEVKRDKLERIVLDEEQRLGQIATVLSINPIYDRSLPDQALALVEAVADLVKSVKAQQVPAATSDTSEGKLPAAEERLAAEERSAVSAEQPDEADLPVSDFFDLSEVLTEEPAK